SERDRPLGGDARRLLGACGLDAPRRLLEADLAHQLATVEPEVPELETAAVDRDRQELPALRPRVAADLEDVGTVDVEEQTHGEALRHRGVVRDDDPLPVGPVATERPLATDADRLAGQRSRM